jgi:hypothetical protein
MVMMKLLEVVFAFFLGAFTILAVGMYHFIKLFWIYILTVFVFASLFYATTPRIPMDVCAVLGVGMTLLIVVGIKVVEK